MKNNMSDIHEPAFPQPAVFNPNSGPYGGGSIETAADIGQPGISRLEFFAYGAMAALATPAYVDPDNAGQVSECAKQCFNLAEAMCAEANRRLK